MNTAPRIPQAPFPSGYRFRDIQLEMSLKPFWDNSLQTQEEVCRELFLQWFPLCRHAESISVMLWVGDGSEILEYQGDLGAEFEWGRYLGSANALHAEPVPDTGDVAHTAIIGHIAGRDPEQRGVHLKPYLYRGNPAKFSYQWLRGLVSTIRRVGEQITGKKIFVGETFDIGPEFAVSRFKYQWHREKCGSAHCLVENSAAGMSGCAVITGQHCITGRDAQSIGSGAARVPVTPTRSGAAMSPTTARRSE